MKINKTQIEYMNNRFMSKFNKRMTDKKESFKYVDLSRCGSYNSIEENKVLYDLVINNTDLPLKDFEDRNYYNITNYLKLPRLEKAIEKYKKCFEKEKKDFDDFYNKEHEKMLNIIDEIILGNEEFTDSYNKF